MSLDFSHYFSCSLSGEILSELAFSYFFLDINECLTSLCHSEGTCANTAGSFTCACNAGYTGNGFVCLSTY